MKGQLFDLFHDLHGNPVHIDIHAIRAVRQFPFDQTSKKCCEIILDGGASVEIAGDANELISRLVKTDHDMAFIARFGVHPDVLNGTVGPRETRTSDQGASRE